MARVETDVCIIGAGPAGLTAAIEVARRGLRAVLMDSNLLPGGQLIKQIHKFFGSSEHRAGTRGVDIARILHKQALELGVDVWLDSSAFSISGPGMVEVARGVHESHASKRKAWREVVNAQALVIAAGACENALRFDGWTLPGVMGAGAAQTMINVERVLPGKRVVMVGAGNVGLIVSYQLRQAGARIVAVVEAASKVGGYGVHAAKIRRAGIPILTSHTVARAVGEEEVENVFTVALDNSWKPIPSTERCWDADTICIATGLRPLARLAQLAGCELTYLSALGGWVPVHNREMQSSSPGVFVAGDIAGVEEASTAMEEGKLAGLGVVARHRRSDSGNVRAEIEEAIERLTALRGGPHGLPRLQAKESLVEAGESTCRTA